MGLLGMLNSLARKHNDSYSDDDDEMRDDDFDEESLEEEDSVSGPVFNLDNLSARERRQYFRNTRRTVRMYAFTGESRWRELTRPFWRWWYKFWDKSKPILKIIKKVLIIAIIAYVVIGLFIYYVIL